jgi:2-amino-4-hydroxy-6-hydroxymethyldihydropteridine diphosphokinase
MNIPPDRKYSQSTLNTKESSLNKKNSETNIAYLSFGSNKADTITGKIKFIEKAIESLKENMAIQVRAISSLYETKPIGLKEANPANFINAVCRIETQLSPYQLLEICKQIEQKLGRGNEEKGLLQSRFIDIDILFFNDLILDNSIQKNPGEDWGDECEERIAPGIQFKAPPYKLGWGYSLVDLHIPHPRCCERDFILMPLEEVIESNWVEPKTKLTFKEIRDKCQMNSIVGKHYFSNQMTN